MIFEYDGITDQLEVMSSVLPYGLVAGRATASPETGRLYLMGGWDCSEVRDEIIEYTPPQYADNDCDGLANRDDNCPDVVNPDQSDADGDGIGDVCDICAGDANGDGMVDPLDSGFVQARFGCIYPDDGINCLKADANLDGFVDPLDVGYVMARFGVCP